MKNFLFLFVVMFGSQLTFASGSVTGKIVELKAHARDYGSGMPWNNRIWITIEGISNVSNTCMPTSWSNGLSPFFIQGDDALYSLALAAKMSDKTVNVYINSGAKEDSACKVEWLGVK